MFQASYTHRRSSSPGSRVWSHNTGYTGAAGLHSEVGSGTHARNQLTQRRTSNTLIAEEDILKKEMKALRANRKNLETSMLMYSQKMRDITERNSQPRKSPVPFHTKYPSTEKNMTKIKTNSVSLLSSNKADSCDISNLSSRSSDNASRTRARKQESRMSVDSGISLESHRDSIISTNDTCSSERGSLRLNDIKESVSTESESNQNTSSEAREMFSTRTRGRAIERKRFRDSKTSKLAPVIDKEINENEEMVDTAGEDQETPRIMAFPDELIHADLTINPIVLESIMESEDILQDNKKTNKVTNSLCKRNKNGVKAAKSKTRTPYVVFRPKPAQSPSLAALRMRHRLFKRFGPNSVYFRYSEEVLEALRSLSNSPDRQKSGNSFGSMSSVEKRSQSVSPSRRDMLSFSPPASPELHGVDLDEILETYASRPFGLASLFMDDDDIPEFFVTKDYKSPKMSLERSFAASASNVTQQSFMPKLVQAKEHDHSLLKPALKKEDGQYSTEKKNVQFFLPDIFARANMCTSQPSELR